MRLYSLRGSVGMHQIQSLTQSCTSLVCQCPSLTPITRMAASVTLSSHVRLSHVFLSLSLFLLLPVASAWLTHSLHTKKPWTFVLDMTRTATVAMILLVTVGTSFLCSHHVYKEGVSGDPELSDSNTPLCCPSIHPCLVCLSQAQKDYSDGLRASLS